MANKKAEILTMDGQVVSPITLATNVLLDDGRTAQDLLDSRDESMFSPTITTSTSMSKVGQGDNVDYSENIIDGAYKSCVLKGKTLVNHNAEGNNRNEYACMPSLEGSNLTVNGTVESKVKSAILKGNTLVNISPFANKIAFSSSTISETKKVLQTLNQNTKYILIFNINNSTSSLTSDYVMVRGYNTDGAFKEYGRTIKNFGNGKHYILLESTQGDVERIFIGSNFSCEIDDTILTIYQEGMENWDIPYFTGMQSVKMPVLTTTGKNLFDVSKLEGLHENIEMIPNGIRVKNMQIDITRCFANPFKENTQYTFSFNHTQIEGEGREGFRFYYTDGTNSYAIPHSNSSCVGSSSPNKTIKSISLSYNDAGKSELTNIQLEEGTTSTSYEPYKSNILSCNEEVTLRGTGEVKDELDLMTRELTKRVDEIVLDGSENWLIGNTSDGTLSFYCNGMEFKNNLYSNEQINNYGIEVKYNHNDNEHFFVEDNGNRLWLYLNKSRNINDVDMLKQMLSSNNFIINYKTTQESIKTVDLSDNHIYSYKDATHYTCSSEEGSLLPTLTIEEGVKYEAIIKPSTKYSVVFNRTEVASSLTVDLGGATANITSTTLGKNIVQITTLPTLSHNYVIFKGLGNAIKDVQVIEGDVADDVEYFEGMVDVKNPIVINCNTVDTEDENYKSNTVTTNEVVLRSLPNGVNDTLDLETGEYVQRIGEREYQVGDESNSQVLTDKVNTQYELAEPITTTIDLKQHPFAYKDGYVVLTSSSEEVSLTPTIEYSLIANRLGQIQTNQKLVEKQQVQIDELESMVIANLVNTQYQQALNEIKLGVK